jgi:B-cell receptor-associated protein 31
MIQWVFVFSCLVVESIALILLILPLPSAMKKMYMKFIGAVWDQPQIRRVLIGCFIVVLVLFIDTVRTLYSITHKPDDVAVSQTMLISLFRQQRNAYLTGFTLFLLLILYRIQSILNDMFKLEAQTSAVVSQGKNAGTAYDA